MTTDYSFVTQSKYYSPVFNAALFDGPLRLYFAQQHESDALRIYFQVQEQLSAAELRRYFKDHNQCLYIMIYPTAETFEMIFHGSKLEFEVTNLDNSPLVAIRGPLGDESVKAAVDLVHRHLLKIPVYTAPASPEL